MQCLQVPYGLQKHVHLEALGDNFGETPGNYKKILRGFSRRTQTTPAHRFSSMPTAPMGPVTGEAILGPPSPQADFANTKRQAQKANLFLIPFLIVRPQGHLPCTPRGLRLADLQTETRIEARIPISLRSLQARSRLLVEGSQNRRCNLTSSQFRSATLRFKLR